MSKKDLIICFFLFLIAVITRAPLIERMQSHWDAPQYTIAVVRGFNFSQETPAIPGYPLYIALARFFYFFVSDPHFALVLVSVIFSGIGAVVSYIIGKTIYNRAVGLIASIIFLSGSVFYFFGITAYGYIIVPSMTMLLSLVVYQTFVKGNKLGILLGLIFALETGFRPQEIIFIIPLFLLGFCSLSTKERAKAIFSFAVVFSVWFIPYINIVGGFPAFIREFMVSTKSGSIPAPSFTHAFQILTIIAQGLYLSFGLSLVFLVYYAVLLLRAIRKSKFYGVFKEKRVVFYLFWIIPSLFFNVFIRSQHAGYQMTYLSALLILISYSIWSLTKNYRNLLVSVVFILMSFNLFVFFKDRDPKYQLPFRQTSFHYTDLRRSDYELQNKIDFIKQNFKPNNTIIVMDQVFWRQLMYYLPSYKIIVIDALMNKDPQIKNIRIEAYDWLRRAYTYSGNNFKIPPNSKYMILFDNGSGDWFLGKNKVIYKFKGIVDLTVVDIAKAREFDYSYHKVDLIY